jgi:hypothetical protein
VTAADPAAVAAAPVGYCEDMRPYAAWQTDGLCCEYEHCVEHSPFASEETACPVFGHDCPGGVERVRTCEVAD